MLSKINYTLAILIIALNLIILPLNIIVLTDHDNTGTGLTLYLTIANLSLIPAILTFFKGFNKKIFFLILNILGLVLALLGAFFVYAMMTIQC